MAKQIRYGMVGGSNKAFIGDVHRKALNFDPRAVLAAGCFSTRETLNRETGETYGLDPERVYPDYETMARAEVAREDGIDFVVIVTPNATHYPVAKCFLEAGINVFCEKPLCFTVEQAEDLKAAAAAKGLLFGVAHAYTGYTMSKVMREMIADGKIGRIVAVNAEYAQDWLLDELDPGSTGDTNLAVWRTDPRLSGISNCVGDIGTHIENYVAYVTGLRIRRLMATTDKYGKALDLNANITLEYDNGAHGAYWCSQVAAGHCNELIHRGTGAVREKAGAFGRIPSGHPEGLYVAFANLYREFLNAVEAKKAGRDASGFDYPTVDMGLEGVKYVHAVIESAAHDSKWVEL